MHRAGGHNLLNGLGAAEIVLRDDITLGGVEDLRLPDIRCLNLGVVQGLALYFNLGLGLILPVLLC